jgi:hypothetical protein
MIMICDRFLNTTGRSVCLTVLACIVGIYAQPTTSPNLKYWYPLPQENPTQVFEADICVYGATCAGVMAAVQAARSGKTVVLFAFGKHVGGLTSGGLNATDGGSPDVTGGLAREYYNIAGQSGFTASVAEKIFNDFLSAEEVPVHYEHRLVTVEKSEQKITRLLFENGNSVTARMFIDGTYEGDLMAMAGVSYTIGRESNSVYGETWNGQWVAGGHEFDMQVDPYVVEGDSSSGLLPAIMKEPYGEKGEGDKRIQAYCFRMHLVRGADRLAFPMPGGYDPGRYALLARFLNMGTAPRINFSRDTNNHHFVDGAMFIDNVGMNFEWPDGPAMGDNARAIQSGYAAELYQTRERVYQEHVTYQQGVMYFLAHDASVPQAVRDEVSQWGLPTTEYQETGGWTHQLYIREGRRMVSDFVHTDHYCMGHKKVIDAVALGQYNMDSHHCQRVVVYEANGKAYVKNEGNVEIGSMRGYGIGYRSIVPKRGEAENLYVVCAPSASHIAFGSIRMEPVFMNLGQSAAIAASMAIDMQVVVQDLPYDTLRLALLTADQILGPEVEPPLDMDNAIILDNASPQGVSITGDWEASSVTPGFYGADYLHDGNTGKDSKTVRFTPDLTEEGEYRILLQWTSHENRATNVPVVLNHSGGTETITVNMRQNGGSWQSLGEFTFSAGQDGYVEIQTTGTDGYVIADAVAFLPLMPVSAEMHLREEISRKAALLWNGSELLFFNAIGEAFRLNGTRTETVLE